jgi:tripartite-type tricarboxylate transporter receptor subunit TctC
VTQLFDRLNRLLKTLIPVLSVACLPLAPVSAQPYPTSAVRVVVPFPPAGGTDVLTRMVLQTVAEQRGWTFVIENRPGAGGNLGLEQVAKSKADGLTMGMGQTSNLAINPSLYKKMPYDALQDFVPVGLVASQPLVLVVGEKSPHRSLASLVAAARARPGALNMASAGTGTVGHLAGSLFSQRAGIRWTHVPYKGAAPALTDVMGGQVDLNFATPSGAMPLIRSGKLRALAVTSQERLYALPEVPTVAESGYQGFVAEDWKAMVAPAGTPPAAIKSLNEALNAALSKGEVRGRLALDGSKPLGGSPEQLATFIKAEHARWAQAVRESGASAE